MHWSIFYGFGLNFSNNRLGGGSKGFLSRWGENLMDFVTILLMGIPFLLFQGFIHFCNNVITKKGE